MNSRRRMRPSKDHASKGPSSPAQRCPLARHRLALPECTQKSDLRRFASRRLNSDANAVLGQGRRGNFCAS
jgi:hypothetical protein